MERKPLEGVESLLFALGVAVGYVLHMQGFTWWVVLIIVVLIGLALGKLVSYLRNMNKKLVKSE